MSYQIFSTFVKTFLFPIDGKEYISTRSGHVGGQVPRIVFRFRGAKAIITIGREYELEWQTFDSTDVYLDGRVEGTSGNAKFMGDQNRDHTLRAVNGKNKFPGPLA